MTYLDAVSTVFLLILGFALPVRASAQVLEATKVLSAKWLPPDNRRLLIVGQDLDSVGGIEGHEGGYFGHVSQQIGGVTTYTSLPSLAGLRQSANWGAGEIHAQRIIGSSRLRSSALAIGLYLVDQLGPINAGQHDKQISELAEWIREAQRPIYLRIGYEFDGYWNHYEPEEYRKAFQRIVDRFRAVGVQNCAFVWQSGTSPVDDAIEGKHEEIAHWYPGDDYVDWCGMSWFLHSPKQLELSDELLSFARQHHKPVLICESACQGYDLKRGTKRYFNTMLDGKPGEGLERKTDDEIWKEWFVPFFRYIDDNADVIRAVAYINANWDEQPCGERPTEKVIGETQGSKQTR